jgi:O-antigen/teichoic acid export membrane protein
LSIVKKLAGQTAIYGLPSIVGRLINFLLVFLFTQYFDPEVFAAHTEFYAYAAFFLVILPHGMETAFFNFIRKGESVSKVFATTMWSITVVVFFFFGLVYLSREQIADFMEYPEHPEYVLWFAVILFADALATIPFAALRHLQQAKRFAVIRSIGIVLNIILNILFIVLLPLWLDGKEVWYYDPSVGIGYVFIVNLIASVAMLILLVPTIRSHWGGWDSQLWKRMMAYSWPLIFVGLAGIVNETFDRAVMGKLLQTDNVKFDIGVYGAFYKLSIIITIFIQAFRYAAEPFFFERSKAEDAKQTYAVVMDYFVAVCLWIGLATLVFLPWIAPLAIRSESYFSHPDGLKIVPILLLANVLLGIIYNLSIWYKIKEKTQLGAGISIGGAILTIALLIRFIPIYGIQAAAWTTLIVYSLMTVSSYLIGHRHYPVPYHLGKLSLLFIGAIGLYVVDNQWLHLEPQSGLFSGFISQIFWIKAAIVITYSIVVYGVVIRRKKT